MSHMQIIETICKEVEHGFGKRLMAIPSELMESAPESLLKITKEVSGRDILNSAEIGYVELTKTQKILKTKTYRVFAFKDSETDMNHNDALAFAERTHMRLLDKDEAEWFKANFKKLPMWKKSLDKSNWYWTSSVYSDTRGGAWRFSAPVAASATTAAAMLVARVVWAVSERERSLNLTLSIQANTHKPEEVSYEAGNGSELCHRRQGTLQG